MFNDEMLSQDEIEALLRGTEDLLDDSSTDNKNDDQSTPEESLLSSMEKDALGEIGNISFGSSATALSTLLNQKVDITTPTVQLVKKASLEQEFPHPYVAVQVSYTVGFSGVNLLVIKQSDAAIIADLMLGGDGSTPDSELNEIQLSAVQEAMNQMMGSAATSMSTIFNKRVDISPPSIDLLNIKQGEGTETIPNNDYLVKVSFRLRVGSLIDSDIMQLLPMDFAKALVEDLLGPNESVVQETPSTQQNQHSQQAIEQSPQNTGEYSQAQNNYNQDTRQQHYQQPASAPDPYQHMNHYQQAGPQRIGANFQEFPGGTPAHVQSAEFSSFTPTQISETESRNLDMLLDIPLQVTVELGRTKRSVKEILELSSGSIVELDKLAGEPVDILVNNKLIAKGEVVVIEENFGVRVTDIVSQSDRIKKLR
ncbi:flagellar motor switch phosphatase FliY [Bacillus sp. HMF5848]|uniref:flagellar motor switch phosphatase FliY n=1 Tax=Bacillus sp. HMF5848 TaxID=2495421 RepID=UPI000F77D25E|nr:flagellar motor switch phosphatase FliY [Bacillus sp. HMF5848]RSK27036.1 flagellar motor switch phosphatase FliY [Bacillus sp. HMF5848]